MILPSELQAEIDADTVSSVVQNTPITEAQQLLLEQLVKSYPAYSNAVGRWPRLSEKIDEEQATPTMKSYALKAILTALDNLPEVAVESSGSDKRPSFFSSVANWQVKAQDVLNVLYEQPIILGQERYVLVNRPVQSLTLFDNVILSESDTGRRY